MLFSFCRGKVESENCNKYEILSAATKKQIKKARMLLSIDPGFQRNECISAVSQKEPEFIRRKHHNGFEPPEKCSFLR